MRKQEKPEKYTALAVEIKAIFDESRGSAGKRTINRQLVMKGISVGLYLIAKLMKQQHLVSKQPKKHRHYDKEQGEIFSNHLVRQFTPKANTTVQSYDAECTSFGEDVFPLRPRQYLRKPFIYVDGEALRFNAEHEPAGKLLG